MVTGKRWIKVPPKPARPKVPDDFKLEVQKKANQYLESYLKPTFLQPPPEPADSNYLVDLFTKWHQRYFYFCSKYRCVHENCISEFFEDKFARLEYVGDKKFNVSYMRYTEQWFEILQGLSLEECLDEIHQQQLLHP